MTVPRWLSLRASEPFLVVVALLIALSVGVLRASVTPAWANPEEPYHFIRARALARGQFSTQFTIQEVVASVVWIDPQAGVGGTMLNARLQSELGLREAADWQALRASLSTQPGFTGANFVTIGSSQAGEAPAYYWYLATFQWIALRLNLSIEAALIVARITSALLGVLTVFLTYLAARDVFPTAPMMRVGAPLLLAVHPGFMTEMASVNNTAGAVVAVTLLLYASLHWMIAGPSLRRFAPIALGILACLITKTTAYIAVPLVVLPFLFGMRLRFSPEALIAAGVLGVLMAAIMFSPQGATYWYRPEMIIIQSLDAPTGASVLPAGGKSVRQPIDPAVAASVQGQSVTLGAWMRSPLHIEAPLPEVWTAPYGEMVHPLAASQLSVQVGPEWEFYSTTFHLPADTQCIEVRINRPHAYYDGIQLMAGSRNLVLNPGFEQRRLLLHPNVEQMLPISVADTSLILNIRLAALQDWRVSLPVLWVSSRWMFTSFWSRILWTLPGLPAPPIYVLGVLTLISAAGLAMQFIRALRAGEDGDYMQQHGLLLCIAYVLGGVTVALLRVDPPSHVCTAVNGRFIGAGYYITPFAAPFVILWIAGLAQWLPAARHRWLIAAGFLFIAILNVASLVFVMIPYALALYGLPSPATWWTLPR